MESSLLVEQIRYAFSNAPYPGDENIVHCSYDKRHGGTLDGPCRECTEVFEAFVGKEQFGHQLDWMSGVSFGLASISPAAFLYFLPTAMEMSLTNIDSTGAILESLEFRFDGTDSAEWQNTRIGQLTSKQLDVVENYFLYEKERLTANTPNLTNFYEEENIPIAKTIEKYRARLTGQDD